MTVGWVQHLRESYACRVMVVCVPVLRSTRLLHLFIHEMMQSHFGHHLPIHSFVVVVVFSCLVIEEVRIYHLVIMVRIQLCLVRVLRRMYINNSFLGEFIIM